MQHTGYMNVTLAATSLGCHFHVPTNVYIAHNIRSCQGREANTTYVYNAHTFHVTGSGKTFQSTIVIPHSVHSFTIKILLPTVNRACHSQSCFSWPILLLMANPACHGQFCLSWSILLAMVNPASDSQSCFHTLNLVLIILDPTPASEILFPQP